MHVLCMCSFFPLKFLTEFVFRNLVFRETWYIFNKFFLFKLNFVIFIYKFVFVIRIRQRMKTDKSKTKEVAVFKDMNSNSTAKQGKKLAVGIKTEAFGDKENLVQKCRLTFANDSTKGKLTEQEDLNIDKKFKVNETEEQTKDKKRIIAEDLTSEAGPSEHYWETLAEKRRQALEDALNENSLLHEKNELLQKENETLKQALAEATEVIDCLNEIISEEKVDQDETSSNNEEETNTDGKKSPVKSSEEAFGDESTILNDTV